MAELQELSLADYAAMLKQAEAGISALTAARDVRYAEQIQDFAETVIAENVFTETPTSNYAGTRVQFPMVVNGRDVIAYLDFKDVKRTNERKAEKEAAEKAKKAEPASEPADA